MARSGPRPAAQADREGRRPQRADARRNRERILGAAEAVLAAHGVGASTEEIARLAGVGAGTLFRHFPTKEALIAAVVAVRVRRLADEADALLAASDPGAAFFVFFARAVEQAATKRVVADALGSAPVDVDAVEPGLSTRLRGGIAALLARAQGAGAVRDDARLPAVLALLAGAIAAAERAGDDDTVRARVLAIILDGLRPAGRR